MNTTLKQPSCAEPGKGFLAAIQRPDGPQLWNHVMLRARYVVDEIGTVGDLFSALVARRFLDGPGGEELACEIDENPIFVADLDLLQDRIREDYRRDLIDARIQTVKALAQYEESERCVVEVGR